MIGLILYIPLSSLLPLYYSLLLLFITAFSFWIAGRAEKIYGKKDCRVIVIDEVVGMMVTMAFFPATLQYLIPGFLIFRVFDVLKPFPARWIDSHMKGGTGVVLDDVVAGIYSNLVLRLLILTVPQLRY